MGTRRKSRELVLQMLFQADMGKQSPECAKDVLGGAKDVDEEVRGFAEDLFRVASDRLEEIDGLIGKHTQHWHMDRMAAVDRNVLRGAVAEFLGYPETPRAIVINEAIEIARRFSRRSRCSLSMACSIAWGKNSPPQGPQNRRCRKVVKASASSGRGTGPCSRQSPAGLAALPH